MEYGKQIIYMAPGDEFEGYYLLNQAAVKTSSNGRPYLSVTVSDAGGSIDGKQWDYPGGISQDDIGKIVKIRGDIQDYKGTNQITIRKIRLATTDDPYEISDIIPTAPIDSVKELEYIRALIESLTDPDYKTICEYMFDRHITVFGRLPAAKSVHHSFLSGLLMHTANMLRTADFLATNIYPETVDRNLLIAGTLLHDFAKEREFALNELGTVTGITTDGILLGHLVMGAEEIGQLGKELDIPGEKIVLLQHMILSHHGKPEYGAAVIPCIAESELLSYIDLMDSRMEIYAEHYEKMEPGETSTKIYSLEKRIYKHE